MDHIVTALTAQKRNPNRVNLFLDGEFAFSLQRITAAWLEVGQKISDEKIAQLQTEDGLEKTYQKALNLLSHRPHTEAEILRKLQEADIPQDLLALVMSRLKENGLVDDARFADAWIENRSEFRPRGRRALAYELRQRGVETELIEEALEEIDEEALAYQAATRRAVRIKELEWVEFRQKLIRFLAQRGFQYDVSAQVIARVWTEIHQPDRIPDEGV